jgi:hypothetical protein
MAALEATYPRNQFNHTSLMVSRSAYERRFEHELHTADLKQNGLPSGNGSTENVNHLR